MCDCRKTYTEKIRENTGDPKAKLREAIIFDDDNKTSLRLTIPVTYRKKNKQGEFNKKESTIDIICGYCPFCGEKAI